MTKSRKLVYSVCSGDSRQNGSEGRVGPPESAERTEKHGKHGKHGKTRFLRGTRASGQGCHIEAIVVYLARSGQARTGHLAPPEPRTGGVPAIAIAPLPHLDGEEGRR